MTGSQNEAGSRNEARRLVAVVCEKHGLRYNPQIHSGCVRCRKEAGETISAAAAAHGGASAEPGGSIAAALAVTFLLVMVSSGVFYAIHKSAWDAAQEAQERWLEEGGPDDLTPEQREQLEKLEEMLEGMPDAR